MASNGAGEPKKFNSRISILNGEASLESNEKKNKNGIAISKFIPWPKLKINCVP